MAQAIPIMNILRVPPRGQLVVELDGQRYGALSDIPDGKLRRRVMAAIGELVTFAEGYEKLVEAGYAAPLQPPEASPAPATAEETTAAQAAFLARLEKQTDAVRQSLEDTQKEGRRSLLRGRLQGNKQSVDDVDVAPVAAAAPGLGGADQPPLTVAEQIDRILQRQVAQDPALAGRIVRLEQAPQGRLRIIVDGRSFDRPGDVTDRNVQAAIKRALREWDQS